jgi:hypothetical protein
VSMIDFGRSLRILYLKDLSNKSLKHEEKLLLVVACLSKGVVGERVPIKTIRRGWLKSIFKVVYHYQYAVLAEDEGWVDRSQTGTMSLTDAGLDRLNSLFSADDTNPLADVTQLMVFSPKQTHDFDKLLRQILAAATKHVRIADSYVDETIFDNFLHVIKNEVKIELMFNHDSGIIFHTTAKRFRVQFASFTYAKYPKLHDRYITVDDIAFVIGPSLKDAVVDSPALLVRIGSDQSSKLISLFDNIYSKQKKII